VERVDSGALHLFAEPDFPIMKMYQHTQPATDMLVIMSVISLGLAISSVAVTPLLAGAAIVLWIAWLFRSMTLEIAGGEFQWRLGSGWLRKRIRLSDIASVQIVRPFVSKEWGVRYSRFGWLYDVSPVQAVAVWLRNGNCFCFRTDEPEILAAQLGIHLKSRER